MAVLGAVAFMLVAGWQFGVSGTKAVFSETEVALENAVAGSTLAVGCIYTGDSSDSCRYGNYIISRCDEWRTIMQQSTCYFNP